MPGGRPSKYSEEMLDKAIEYVDGGYQNQGDVVPSAVGMAKYLGVADSTLYGWAEDPDKSEFSSTFRSIQAEQHRLLLSGGLSGNFNASITKLMLSNHGYIEKTDNTHHHDFSQMSDDELQAIINGDQ